MTHHSAPPGDWQPPEPPWMKDARQCVAEMRKYANRHMDTVAKQMAFLTRFKWQGFLLWMSGGIVGQLFGLALVEWIKWKAGLK